MYEDNIKIHLGIKGCTKVKWNELPDNRVYLRALSSSVFNLQAYTLKLLAPEFYI
jgi:hypothetical protein